VALEGVVGGVFRSGSKYSSSGSGSVLGFLVSGGSSPNRSGF
jgi:hypothetical protein